MIRVNPRPVPLEDILVEHMEEAAFMYESRLRSFVDPELSWRDLFDFENRMLPHLQALALGGLHSAKLLKDKLTIDEMEEPGEAFVASFVYTTLEFIEPMQWLIDALGKRPAHIKAIVDGLKYSRSKALEGWLEDFIDHENPVVRSVGAEVIGYRGVHRLKEKLIQLRNDPDPHVSIAALHSLFEMNAMPDGYDLRGLLNEDAPSLVLKAIEMLLRLGESDIIGFCREKCASSEADMNRRLIFYLAITGDLKDADIIVDLIERQPEIKRECLLALGMAGHAGSLELLVGELDRMDDWKNYTAAFQGLRFITGMDFIPEFDPDEPTPDEIMAYKTIWRDWLNKHQSNFSNGFKWRRGERLSPYILYKDLTWSGNPCRDMSYLEMVMRYDCSEGFHADHFFEVQQSRLKELENWATGKNTSYHPGLLYYKGKLVS